MQKKQLAKANRSSPRGNRRKYNVVYNIDGILSFIQGRKRKMSNFRLFQLGFGLQHQNRMCLLH
ncbi:hypothetical protein CN285_14685 [Bacillus cereus]|nr:hypothetical protein CN285_14685 [Bacillus cereus]PGM58234.1 hypothetical protein CN947_22430 [Bacillus cereus]